MAVTVGDEYYRLDVTDGTDTVQHPIKDAKARENIGDLKSAVEAVEDVLIGTESEITFADSYRVGVTLVDSGTWVSQSNGGFMFAIPDGADKLYLQANENTSASYAFLTSNNTSSAPQFATGCKLVWISAGTEYETNIPSDATYLFVNRRPISGSTLRTPQSGKYRFFMDIKGDIETINDEIVEIQNAITTKEYIDFVSADRIGATLLSNDTWLSQSNGGFMIPVPDDAKKIYITANADSAASYAFLKSNDITQAPSYATGSGYTSVQAGATAEEAVPSDAVYLYVQRRPVTGNTLTIPENAYFIIPMADVTELLSKKFYATYETVDLPQGIGDYNGHHLSLIATKKDNSFNVDNLPIQNPYDIGYLYVDEHSEPQKMYYSANRYDRPTYLCDWKPSVAGGRDINIYCPFITRDGDIIFLMQGKQQAWAYPVVYPHGDYSNPVSVQITPLDGYLPAGITTDAQVCVSFSDNFVLFGDYHRSGDSSLIGKPMRIWKATAPFTNPENWKVVLTKYYTTTEPSTVGDDITHWHTVTYDQYTGRYYANTGDFSKSCHVYESDDDGETWTLVASDGQMWRALGYVFTKDGCYWGTDSSQVANHALYFAGRDGDGIVDFSTTIKLASCKYDAIAGVTNLQRTYNTCLCRNPDGILLLDRAEERYDGLLNLEFYSFDDQKMHLVDVLHNTGGTEQTRYGFGNYAVTQYQSVEEDGIICGGMDYERVFSLDMLNNSAANRVGVTKITIHRINN